MKKTIDSKAQVDSLNKKRLELAKNRAQAAAAKNRATATGKKLQGKVSRGTIIPGVPGSINTKAEAAGPLAGRLFAGQKKGPSL